MHLSDRARFVVLIIAFIILGFLIILLALSLPANIIYYTEDQALDKGAFSSYLFLVQNPEFTNETIEVSLNLKTDKSNIRSQTNITAYASISSVDDATSRLPDALRLTMQGTDCDRDNIVYHDTSHLCVIELSSANSYENSTTVLYPSQGEYGIIFSTNEHHNIVPLNWYQLIHVGSIEADLALVYTKYAFAAAVAIPVLLFVYYRFRTWLNPRY